MKKETKSFAILMMVLLGIVLICAFLFGVLLNIGPKLSRALAGEGEFARPSSEGVIAREECESFCEAAGSYLVAIEYDLTTESAQCVCALPDQE